MCLILEIQHKTSQHPSGVTKATPMAHSTHTFVTLGRVSNGNPAIRGHTSKNTGAPPPAIKTAASRLLSQLMAQFNNNLSLARSLPETRLLLKRRKRRVRTNLTHADVEYFIRKLVYSLTIKVNSHMRGVPH